MGVVRFEVGKVDRSGAEFCALCFLTASSIVSRVANIDTKAAWPIVERRPCRWAFSCDKSRTERVSPRVLPGISIFRVARGPEPGILTGGVDDAIVAVVAAVDGAGAGVVAGTGADRAGVGCAGAGAGAGGDVTDVGDDVVTGTELGSGTKIHLIASDSAT